MRRTHLLGAEALVLVLLAIAYAIRGRFVGMAILLLLGALGLSAAWALWPTGR